MSGLAHGIVRAIGFSVASLAFALAPGSSVAGNLLSLRIALIASNSFQLEFTAQPNTGYVLEYRDSLSSGTWQELVVLDPITSLHEVLLTEPLDPARAMRFYRVRDAALTALTEPTSGPVEYPSELINAPQETGSAGLLAESPFHYGSSAVQRTGTVAALSATQAGGLAQTLANDRARTLFSCQPFHSYSSARFVDGHWLWRGRRGLGPVDFDAEVSFEADGANPEVKVLLLDSRLR